MNAYMVAFTAFLFLVLAAFLIYETRQNRRHELRVRKLYASPVMDELQHELRFAKKHAVELARVDKTGVYLRFLSPGYGEYRYRMRDHGFANLTPEQQNALRTVLEEQLPHFDEKDYYRLSRKNVYLPNGKTEHVYSYTMTNRYKEKLTRAPQYAPQMQPYTY